MKNELNITRIHLRIEMKKEHIFTKALNLILCAKLSIILCKSNLVSSFISVIFHIYTFFSFTKQSMN